MTDCTSHIINEVCIYICQCLFNFRTSLNLFLKVIMFGSEHANLFKCVDGIE